MTLSGPHVQVCAVFWTTLWGSCAMYMWVYIRLGCICVLGICLMLIHNVPYLPFL